MRKRHTWPAEDIELLKQLYHNNTTENIAKKMGLSLCQVYNQAFKLGLKKDTDFLTGPTSGRMQKGDTRGLSTRFKKGSIPVNKGQKMPPEVYEKVKATFFKKGQWPKSTKYFGQPYLFQQRKKNGQLEKYWLIQINRKRRGYLSYLCEQNGIDLKGKIPRLKSDYSFDRIPTIDDIIIIGYKDNMLENSLHRFPEDLRNLIQIKGALQRQLNKISKYE